LNYSFIGGFGAAKETLYSDFSCCFALIIIGMKSVRIGNSTKKPKSKKAKVANQYIF